MAHDPAPRPVRLVRRPRLGAAPPSARDAGAGRGPVHLADRTHRGRQDAGGVLAVVGRIGGRPSGPPHPLHLSPQGARRRHPPQPAPPGRRREPAHPDRGSHRRHHLYPAPPPARRPAAYPAHHARKPRALAQLRRRPAHFCGPAPRCGGRTPRAGRKQARRSADAGTFPAGNPLARPAPRRPVSHGRRCPGVGRLSGRGHRGSDRRSRPRPRHHHARHRHTAALGGGRRALCHTGNPEPDHPPPDHADLSQHPRAGGNLFPPPLAGQFRRPAHRHPSRLTVPRTARTGRGSDGVGCPARRGLHRQP